MAGFPMTQRHDWAALKKCWYHQNLKKVLKVAKQTIGPVIELKLKVRTCSLAFQMAFLVLVLPQYHANSYATHPQILAIAGA